MQKHVMYGTMAGHDGVVGGGAKKMAVLSTRLWLIPHVHFSFALWLCLVSLLGRPGYCYKLAGLKGEAPSAGSMPFVCNSLPVVPSGGQPLGWQRGRRPAASRPTYRPGPPKGRRRARKARGVRRTAGPQAPAQPGARAKEGRGQRVSVKLRVWNGSFCCRYGLGKK